MSDFLFFHGFDEALWSAFERHGLAEGRFGLRFCQNVMLDDEKKFNRLAAPGSLFARLVAENDLPWYVDRLQGGVYIDEYPYDLARVDALGGEFYGFQLHEWMSNLRSDYDKLSGLPARGRTEESIVREIRRRYPFPHLFLEAATAREFAEEFPVPPSFEVFLDHARRLFEKRSAFTGGRLLPCDSFMMAPALEFGLGARRVMPEIGAQTPGAHIQLAYARGSARAAGRSFGAYYEPWGGEPFSVCDYCRGENEWGLRDTADFPFHTDGPNGGSSRSLQRRLFLYAYLAGASFFSEEWGLFNTFSDPEGRELSPYGLVKREFLDFVRRVPAGEFYAPAAIVLPRGTAVLCDPPGGAPGSFPFASPDAARRAERAAAGIRRLMGPPENAPREARVLPGGTLPDAFDIVNADDEAALSRYELLVDLTGDPGFALRRPNAVTPDEAAVRIVGLMPCRVSGGAHWFFDRLPDGWILGLFNNEGILRSVAGGERKDPAARRTAVVSLGREVRAEPLFGGAPLHREGDSLFVELEAGDAALLRLSR